LAQLSGPTPKPQPAPKLDTIQLDPTQRKILQALPLEQRAQARADMLASAHAIAQARRQMAAANEGEGDETDSHDEADEAATDKKASEATAPFHIYYYHPDQIGTPRELTNAEGQIVWRAEYLAWGNTLKLHWLTDAAPVEQPLRFQGQYYDEETGLHYNRFRYYDPDLGRFVSQDPIGLLGGNNFFEYALNPTGWVDPLGLAACNPRINIKKLFKGEVRQKKNGLKAVGFHHRGSIGSDSGARITRITDAPNAQGIYRAKVEIKDPTSGQWVTKSASSTFYPDSWSRARVLEEIKSAYADALATGQVVGDKFTGTSCSGVKIEGFMDGNGVLDTAYPVM
ncbi:RHS repeat-associated core domain-containing protein, partial [Parachitinimonas caeni]